MTLYAKSWKMHHSKIIAAICIFLHIVSTKPSIAMEQQAPRGFEMLPIEIEVEILKYFSFKQAYMYLGVCKLWYTILWEMLPGKLGPGSSYETLKECAELIIKHNRKVRKYLLKNASKRHRKKHNRRLRDIIDVDCKDFQQQKFDVIQCLLHGSYLNAKNNGNEYYSDSIVYHSNLTLEENSAFLFKRSHDKQTQTDFLFFLLSLGSVLPQNTSNDKILKTCQDIANFNESKTDKGEELTNLLNQLDGKVIPNFYASEARSAFEEVYHATGRLFLLSYADIFLAAGTARYFLWKEETIPLNNHYFNDNDIDHFEKLIHLHRQLGTDLMRLFSNTLESNPNHDILEKLYAYLNISDDKLKEFYELYAILMFQMKYLPDKNKKENIEKAYNFLSNKISSIHIS